MGCICLSTEAPINPEQVDLTHFTLLSTVGKGGFGKVKAAQDRKDPVPRYDDADSKSSHFYAVKLQDLRELIRKESHIKAAWVERNVMSTVNSPFVVKLHYAFVSSTDLVLVMPFLRGGDLSYFLDTKGAMKEDMARYYIAQIMLGMEAIHNLMYVYRDLKPDNCLFGARGHLLISDLGLATKLSERDKRYGNEIWAKRYPPPHHMRTRGCCGTPGYVAPEVINKHSYGFMPDFFSVGCTLAKMLTKRVPFHHKLMDKKRVARKDFPPPSLPSSISKECKSFVRALCSFDVDKRLGYKNFWREAMDHPFFTKDKSWSWKRMRERKESPLHVPSLKKLNFNPVFEAEEQIMAEGRKPLDQNEQIKVAKVFKGIGYNTSPPFRNSNGQAWPNRRRSNVKASENGMDGEEKAKEAKNIQENDKTNNRPEIDIEQKNEGDKSPPPKARYESRSKADSKGPPSMRKYKSSDPTDRAESNSFRSPKSFHSAREGEGSITPVTTNPIMASSLSTPKDVPSSATTELPAVSDSAMKKIGEKDTTEELKSIDGL